MKITRTITFETDDQDAMRNQLAYSAPDGTFRVGRGITMTIKTDTVETDVGIYAADDGSRAVEGVTMMIGQKWNGPRPRGPLTVKDVPPPEDTPLG